MRFGVREICDVVLRAKSYQTLGSRKFYKNEPVLYFDTLKTSSLEGAATTVYAQGGRGNTRLIAWEGERTLTFTMEDALLSMESFSVLSGAGLIDATEDAPIYVHTNSQVEVEADNTIVLPNKACWNGLADTDEMYHKSADIFVMVLKNGEVADEPCIPVAVENGEDTSTLTCYSHAGVLPKGTIVLVDYYVKRTGGAQMIEITADKFAGNYYLEASTLFRRESDGVDMPAEFIIPNCKIQSNFTFSLAATGDPSTFTFTMDAFPDYTKFDQTKKVLAAIQVITDESGETEATREPCKSADDLNSNEAAVAAKAAGVTATMNGDIITVTGSSDGTEYDTALFGSNLATAATEVTITLPTSKDGGTYTVIQNNPILSVEFSGDANVSGNTKTKSYTIESGETLDYSFLVSELGGPITVELQDSDGATLATYTVATAVSFA